jgi:hypothetical protein
VSPRSVANILYLVLSFIMSLDTRATLVTPRLAAAARLDGRLRGLSTCSCRCDQERRYEYEVL